MTAAQAIATALRASLVGIVCFVVSWTPAKAAAPPTTLDESTVHRIELVAGEDGSFRVLNDSTGQEQQGPVSTAAADAPPDKLLAKLDEAERLWNAAQPRSYSYSMTRAHAFTRVSYEISVRDGRCTARSKNAQRRRARWESVGCEGLTITDVFANLRKEWLGCPGASAQVSFDDRYGYIKEISFEPNIDLSDQFWDLTLSRFKAGR